MPIQWEPRLALGVPLVDRQHRELIDALNAVVAAMAASRAREEVGPLLDFLGRYVATHFADEEQLMRSSRYPAAAAHQAEHAEFTAAFRGFAAEFARSGATTGLAIRLNGATCEWLREHIGGSDRKLAAWLTSQAAPRAG
jgi:hemerythrin